MPDRAGILTAVHGPCRHPETAATSYHLGEVLRMRGRVAAAAPYYRDSLQFFRETGAMTSPLAVRRLGRYIEVRAPGATRSCSAIPPRNMDAAARAQALVEAKDWKAAGPPLQQLLDMIDDSRGGGHDQAAQTGEGLARLLRNKGRAADARRILETTLRARTERHGEG